MKHKLALVLLSFLLGMQCMVAQQIKVAGVVISEDDGEPVIGASIIVKGTTTGTITDIDGKFVLNAEKNAKLVVSYVGLKTLETTAQPNMRIALSSDSQAIDEVVVVAYGTAKKSSFTGAASTIGAALIDKRPLSNATSALEGNTSGVQVTSSIGQPGESAKVRIRGFGSVNADNAPLYVVDGAIFIGDIASINPSDIEAMTVLKDAASTSLYGSSAGNGVILITTKKGSTNNGAGVTLNISQGWSTRAYKDYAATSLYDYYPLQWQMLKNSYITGGKDAATAAALASGLRANTKNDGIYDKLKYNPFVNIGNDAIVGIDGLLNPGASALKWGDDLNWDDEAYRTGHRQEYNVSYNTKTDKSDTYASIGYLNDKGYMLKTDFERYSGRLNYNIYPVKWFKSGLNLGLSRTNSNYSTSTDSNSSGYGNLTRFIRTMAPIYPIHRHDLETGAYLDADRNPTTDPNKYIYDYDGARISNNGRDAIAETLWNDRQLESTVSNARTYVTITPMEGLSATVNYALDNTDQHRKVYENPLVGDGTAGPGRLNIRQRRYLTQTLNELINYNKTFGKHNIEALLGHENYSYKFQEIYTMKTQEVVSGIYELGNFIKVSEASSFTREYKKEGYFARLNYNFDDKYYASASFRRDGSSRFSKGNRWGNFWSFGASWRVSQENFMKEFTWVNNLKLRASYGETGNDAILNADSEQDYYPAQMLYELGPHNNNGLEGGVYFYTMANTGLTWETQVSTDVAVEFGLFDRLTGTVEYFNKTSRDLLFDVSQPLSSGIKSIVQNLGKVRNQGVEIELDYRILNNRDWRLSVGANATFINNKLTRLPEVNRENGIISSSKKYMEGHSIYDFWLRQWWGVNPDNGDGLYLLDTEAYNEKDGTLSAGVKKTVIEKDGQQLTNSYTYAKFDYSGSAVPKVYGGFNFKLGYKDFDLSGVFSYSLGGKVLDSNYLDLMSTSKYGYSMSPDIAQAWTTPGQETDVPRLDNNSTHATNIGQSYSTRWLVSSNYLNLRTVSLSYTLPKSLLSAINIKTVRVNVSAENLFMLKARQGLNPQANYTGITYNEYLPAKNITLGLNVSF